MKAMPVAAVLSIVAATLLNARPVLQWFSLPFYLLAITDSPADSTGSVTSDIGFGLPGVAFEEPRRLPGYDRIWETQRLLARWQPATVVVLGIAGGIDNDVRLGDVVAATAVESYLEDAKAVDAAEPDRFDFRLAGDTFRPSGDLAKEILNFKFAHSRQFETWQADGWRRKIQESQGIEHGVRQGQEPAAVPRGGTPFCFWWHSFQTPDEERRGAVSLAFAQASRSSIR